MMRPMLCSGLSVNPNSIGPAAYTAPACARPHLEPAATFALAQGFTLEDVKQLLGHSSIVLTLNTYGHVLGGSVAGGGEGDGRCARTVTSRGGALNPARCPPAP